MIGAYMLNIKILINNILHKLTTSELVAHTLTFPRKIYQKNSEGLIYVNSKLITVLHRADLLAQSAYSSVSPKQIF